MYNIKETDMNIIKDILRRFVLGAKILVFGSRQNGTEKSYSDLDIAIDCGKKMDWILVADIKERKKKHKYHVSVAACRNIYMYTHI